MSEHRQDPPRRWEQSDLIARSIKTVLGACGPLGGILADFVIEFVPNQRLDRLSDYAEHLGDRMRGLEDAFQARLRASAAYASLCEQTTLAAARAASAQRRRDIAEILRRGLTLPDAELIEQEALLQVLESLNEAQVLILMWYGCFPQTFGDPAQEAFSNAHPGVFDVLSPAGTDDEDVRRRWTMRRFYEDQLVALGLLCEQEGLLQSSPAFPQRRITHLGELLLRAIGRDTVT